MRKPTKKAVAVKTEPLTLYDVNVCAPSFFDIYVGRAGTGGAEFVQRAEAFCETMRDLNRAVMLCHEPETRRLYLASITDISNV